MDEKLPRRILVATVGLNPQIVTETLYALAVERTPSFLPNEIHIITTIEGRSRVELMLLDPSMAYLGKLADDFGLVGLGQALTRERIHVISDSDTRELSDITSEAHNAAAADQITNLVRDLTSDPKAALHVSIAGGRKTMGFLLGYALSLFGRAQDSMSHVLVDQPFEQHPEFFFPPKSPRVLITRENKPINTAEARVVLADIPFVRLRAMLPEALREGRWTYSETVRQTQARVPSPSIIVDHAKRLISFHGIPIRLPHLQFAVYAWLARRRMHLADGDGSTHWSRADPGELLLEYGKIGDVRPGMIQSQESRLRGGIPADTLEQNCSKIRRLLQTNLGFAAEPYEIKQFSGSDDQVYRPIGLALEPEAIGFGAVPEPNADDEL